MKPANEVLVVVTLIVACASIVVCGVALGRNYERQKAIEAGVARWTVNPTNAQTTFVYGKP